MNNIIQIQAGNDLTRMFAPGVIEHHKEPMSLGLRVLVVALFATSALLVCAALGFAYQELKMVDWSAVIQVVGVRR